MRAAGHPGDRERISLQRISDWRAGRNVPARFESFVPVLVTLVSIADRRGPVPPDLRDRAVWRRSWQAARIEAGSAEPPRRGANREVAPEPARPHVISSLRRDLPTFIGRDAELRALLDVTDSDPAAPIRLVTGMAGVGKTALVTRAAHRLAERFPDGRYFVELNAHMPGLAAADPFDVLATLLTDIGIEPGHIPPTLAGRRDLWRDRIEGRRILLVLDDALDHAQVEPLLPGTPGCLTLITARRRMAELDGAVPLELDTLETACAEELFCALGRLAPAGADVAAVARIVRLCGNLPLAIVLLGARLLHHPAWTVAGLAQELSSCHDRLAELEAGQRAVRAAFTTSYQALRPEQQRLFRRLGLHPGPDVDAHAAAALHEIPVAEARRGLDILYMNHLIEETAPGRYRSHSLVGEFARSLAGEDPRADRHRAVDRLLGYYALAAYTSWRPGLARDPGTDDGTLDRPALSTQSDALAWIRAERPNILACLEFAASRNQVGHVVALTAALAVEVRLHGPWQVAVFARRGSAAAPATGGSIAEALAFKDLGPAGYLPDGHAIAADLLRRQLNRDTDIAPPLRTAAARTLVLAYVLAGDPRAAVTVQEWICDRYREAGDLAREGVAVGISGWLHHLCGDEDVAIDLLHRALAITELHGKGRRAADIRCSLAWVYCVRAEYRAATEQFRQARAIYRARGRRAQEAFALAAEAWTAFLMGEWSRARSLGLRSVTIYQELGDLSAQAVGGNAMGLISLLTGDYAVALAQFRQARALYESAGNPFGISSALNYLGRAHACLGDWSTAETLLRRALGICTDIGNRVGLAEAKGNLGWVEHLRGRQESAAELLGESLAVFRAISYGPGETETHNRMGFVALAVGDIACARASFDAALVSACRLHDRIEEARALEGTARCLARDGDVGAARAMLDEALSSYARLGAAEARSVSREL
ncbi:tetratricopeptide repeat protein [Nocardia macrotermitis]|uniref:Orc1-like AAA ATPase domain-containing protein n=1 Tax=Nocardia macrotermitis TaxID=2585198 RepID=A0A7K0CWI0_9NOCA|nr:tetratricopeptide repeat protein [Nocardia macrotermitis]MQY17014.1 hypothetical protein [Nocardia macrotermitis]